MNPTRLSTHLRDFGRESVERLDEHPIAGRLIAGTLAEADYARYLIQVVHQVQGSGWLLERAGQELVRRGRPRLGGLFGQKAGEEDGHHVWAINDLGNIGISRDTVERTLPSAAVQAYNAFGRYSAERDPVAVIGIAWTLEWFGFARARLAADRMVAHSGIPNIAAAVTFLRSHGDADGGHIRELGAALEDIQDPREAELVLLAARLTATLYLGFFDVPEA